MLSNFFFLQGSISVGSHVWAEDAQLAWIDGQVTKINGDNVEIQTSNGKTVVPLMLTCLLFFEKLAYLHFAP